MICKGFTRTEDGQLRSCEVYGGRSGGWNRDDGPMPEPSSVKSMVSIAATAVRTGQRKMPGYPIGGRLLETELTREGMTTVSRAIPE